MTWSRSGNSFQGVCWRILSFAAIECLTQSEDISGVQELDLGEAA
jgi:hypothetical protein